MDPHPDLAAYVRDLHRREAGSDDLADLDARILATGGSMERMKLMEARGRVVADRRRMEAAFIQHAAAWAAAERLTRTAFALEGVPAEVLDRAGLTAEAGRTPRR